jgi:hypothetical protein
MAIALHATTTFAVMRSATVEERILAAAHDSFGGIGVGERN